jgi:hypothetical protein
MSVPTLNCRVTLFSSGKNTKLRFHIDAPRDAQEIPENLFIQGWVIHYKDKIENVALASTEGDVLGSTKPNIIRPRVLEYFEIFHNSKSAGFELNVPNLVAGEYSLIAETSKKQFSLAQFSLHENL